MNITDFDLYENSLFATLFNNVNSTNVMAVKGNASSITFEMTYGESVDEFDILSSTINLLKSIRLIKLLQYVNFNLISIIYLSYIDNIQTKLTFPYYKRSNDTGMAVSWDMIEVMHTDFCKFTSLTASSNSRSSVVDIMKRFANPTLAAIGLLQNVICVVVLRKDGLRKMSNRLLLAVIVAGCSQQLLTLNVAEIIEYKVSNEIYQNTQNWGCLPRYSIVLAVCKHVSIFIGLWGQYVFSSTFMLITSERFLAVYFPLHLRTLVNKTSISWSIALTYVIWLPWVIYKTFCFYKFDYLISNVDFSDRFYETYSQLYLLVRYSLVKEHTAITLSRHVPLFLVLLGSVAIAIRIRTASTRRKKLATSSGRLAARSIRTSKTLLLTCLVFSVSEVLFFVLAFTSESWIESTDKGFMVQSQFVQFSYLLTSFNTFFVLLSTNIKMFRKILCTKRRT